jgi:hypothetical protein
MQATSWPSVNLREQWRNFSTMARGISFFECNTNIGFKSEMDAMGEYSRHVLHALFIFANGYHHHNDNNNYENNDENHVLNVDLLTKTACPLIS